MNNFVLYMYSTDHKQLNVYLRVLANSCEYASSTPRHAYTTCKQKYYTRSNVRASCKCHAHANIASGSTIHLHTGLACVRAHLLIHTHAHSYSTHECCIDLS